jgi:hypothetical protein
MGYPRLHSGGREEKSRVLCSSRGAIGPWPAGISSRQSIHDQSTPHQCAPQPCWSARRMYQGDGQAGVAVLRLWVAKGAVHTADRCQLSANLRWGEAGTGFGDDGGRSRSGRGRRTRRQNAPSRSRRPPGRAGLGAVEFGNRQGRGPAPPSMVAFLPARPASERPVILRL